MRNLIFILVAASIFTSCGGAADRAKDAIKDSGEIVGKTVGEFGKGVSEGLEKTFQLTITLSDSLIEQGIELGKISLENSDGTDNVLVVYIIFKNDFDQEVTAKVFDTADLEMGRSSLTISAEAGKAQFYEFIFNKRTNIDSDSKITMK